MNAKLLSQVVAVVSLLVFTQPAGGRSDYVSQSQNDTLPPPFIMDYTANVGTFNNLIWMPYAAIYRPSGVTQVRLSMGNYCGYNPCHAYEPVVTVLPSNVILHVYTAKVSAAGYEDAHEIEATLMSQDGSVTYQPEPIRLTDSRVVTESDNQTFFNMDFAPSVALAPNGRIAVAWFRIVFNQTHSVGLLDVYYMVLDSNLSVVVPATNLTNNTQWGGVMNPNGPDMANRFYRTFAAATADDRFFIGWQFATAWNADPMAWYTVRDTSGGLVKPVGTLGSGCSTLPKFEPLADGTMFVAQPRECTGYRGNIWVGRLDSAGNVIGNQIALTSGQADEAPDAAQLPGGNIVLAWHHYNGTLYNIRYVVFNAGLGIVRGLTDLPVMSPTGDAFVSVSRIGDQAVLTWGEFGAGYAKPSKVLYFTSLDTSGNTLVQPSPLVSTSDYNFLLTANGQSTAAISEPVPDITPPANPTSLSSPDHTPGVWSNFNDVLTVNWSGASDAQSGLAGYSFVWDNTPATLPDTTIDVAANVAGANQTYVPDGDWYFHIRAVDHAGNWAPDAAHIGPFRIERSFPTNPTGLHSSSHVPGAWSSNNIVNVNWSSADDYGSGLAGYSVLWDHDPTSLPDNAIDVAASSTSASSPALADGDWYVHISSADNAGNVSIGAAHLGPFRIDTVPPVSSAQSPAFASAPFRVTWLGADAGSGIASYDVWVRDGPTGPWTRWLTATSATTAVFPSGLLGHTYAFRSQARDRAANVETDLPPNGDTQTTLARFQVTGRVTNARAEPIFNARVSAQPPALNSAATDGQGDYTLYFLSTGTYTFTASRSGFGALPPRFGISLTGNLTSASFVLPPAQNALANGGFEAGSLAGWSAVPGLSATVETTAAHTGRFGLRLDSIAAPTGPLAPATAACVTQTVAISSSVARPTLSWLYRVAQAAPGAFVVSAAGLTQTLTRSLSLTVGAWTHAWLDLGALAGQTARVCVGLDAGAGAGAGARVYVDEVSAGGAVIGSFRALLPVLQR